MKTFLNKVKKNPMFYVFLAILILFLPIALFREPDSSRRLIITALAIDKQEDEFEVSALCFIPVSTTTFQENYKIISASDKTFVEALNKIGLYSGRISALPHTSVVVVSEQVMESDMLNCLNHLARTSNLGNNTVVIGTNKSAKQLLEITNDLDSSANLSLKDLLSYNYQYLYGNQSNLESFYRGYFSPTKTSILGFMKLDENKGIEVDGKSQDSGGEGSSNSAKENASPGMEAQDSSTNQKILNDGSACIFKDGKLITLLDGSMVEYYNWINNQQNKSILTIEDYTHGPFKNAKLSFQIEQKPVLHVAKFVDNVPQIDYIVNFVLTLDEVNQQKYHPGNFDLGQKVFTPELERKIQNNVKNDFSKLLNILRDNKLDVIDVQKTFFQQDKQKFQKFLDSLDDKDDYLRYVNFNIVTNVVLKA